MYFLSTSMLDFFNYFERLNIDTTPVISSEQAIEIAYNSLKLIAPCILAAPGYLFFPNSCLTCRNRNT